MQGSEEQAAGVEGKLHTDQPRRFGRQLLSDFG
jgi:hypothetical protein